MQRAPLPLLLLLLTPWLPAQLDWTPAGAGPDGACVAAFDVARNRLVVTNAGRDRLAAVLPVYEWDGSIWVRFAPTTGPSPRSAPAMAFDAVRNVVMMFGGGGTADQWEWDGTRWTQRQPAVRPPGREQHVLVTDAVRRRIVLHGGANRGDTWEWDGAAWVQLTTSAMAPRAGHTMAYDIQRHCMVLFGGYTGHLRSDTWELTSTSGFASPYGAGCGVPPLSLQAVPLLPPRIGGTAGANVTQVPAGFAVMALGWNQQVLGPLPLPLSLAGMGMPGCQLLHSAEVFGLDATGGGTWSPFLLGIPDFPALIGQHIYLQAFALAPGVNPAGVVASNGLHWRIGR